MIEEEVMGWMMWRLVGWLVVRLTHERVVKLQPDIARNTTRRFACDW